MSSSTPTIEQLPTNIPHLEPNSPNWAIFKMHFQDAMRVTCQWGHFSGNKPRPKPKDGAKPTDCEIEAAKKRQISINHSWICTVQRGETSEST